MATPNVVDAFIDTLSDGEFATYLADVIATNPGLNESGRQAMRSIRSPRENRIVRAMIYDRFAPRLPRPVDEVPDFDLSI